MNKLPLLVMAWALVPFVPASAQVVPVHWDAAGHFRKELPIAPGKFVEVCEKLTQGAKVSWSFEATAAVDFNIHYHEGKDVRFPEQRNQVSKEEGTLDAGIAQDYCWMWTNKNAAEARLTLRLTKS